MIQRAYLEESAFFSLIHEYFYFFEIWDRGCQDHLHIFMTSFKSSSCQFKQVLRVIFLVSFLFETRFIDFYDIFLPIISHLVCDYFCGWVFFSVLH